MRLVHVAVPVPAIEALTYGVPDPLPLPVTGARVLVPLGTRILTGVVVRSEKAATEPPEVQGSAPEIKDIIDVLDDTAFLPADVLRLTGWVAEYYACGAGDALSAAMPPRAWIESERHAQISETGSTGAENERGLRAEILGALRDGRPRRVDAIAFRSGSYSALAGLDRDGLVRITRPLVGIASAYRTVRVASLTAQGHE